VPIFVNNKKKRLKQALYANPTTDDFGDSTTVTSIESNRGFNGDNHFEANDTSPQKQSFPQPQRVNRFTNERNYDSLPASRQSQFPIRGRGGITNVPSCTGSLSGNNQGGIQSRTQVKREPQRFQNTFDGPSRANATIKNNGARFVCQDCRN